MDLTHNFDDILITIKRPKKAKNNKVSQNYNFKINSLVSDKEYSDSSYVYPGGLYSPEKIRNYRGTLGKLRRELSKAWGIKISAFNDWNDIDDPWNDLIRVSEKGFKRPSLGYTEIYKLRIEKEYNDYIEHNEKKAKMSEEHPVVYSILNLFYNRDEDKKYAYYLKERARKAGVIK